MKIKDFILIVVILLLIVTLSYVVFHEFKRLKQNIIQEAETNVLIQVAQHQTSSGNIYLIQDGNLTAMSINQICGSKPL